MSHHSSDAGLSDAMKALVESVTELSLQQEQAEAKLRFGATGNFPEGKVAPHDEGEIRFGVAADKGKVFVDFGKPVRSLGMNAEQANELADVLKRAADEAHDYDGE